MHTCYLIYRLMLPASSIDVGHVLNGRYRLDALVLARRGATQFAGTDLARGEAVTVTVHGAGAPATLDWFLGGAEWAKTLGGPHVARVVEAGVAPGGFPWIVREPVASAPLAVHLVRQGALRTADAVDVILAVCDALAEAHGKGVLHGGLGPHAVHAAWSGAHLVDVKVVGIGTALAETALTLGAAATGDGVLRAPEQLRHAPLDPRVDVWALGALLYTLLAGAPPFRPDAPAGAGSVLFDDPPPLAPHVPTPLADILERCLAKDPADRPRHVLELADAISFYATSPDFARDRITARRPALGLPLPAGARTSGPVRVLDRREAAIAVAATPTPLPVVLPPVMVDGSLLEITRKRAPMLPASLRAMVPVFREGPRRRSIEQTVVVRQHQPRRRALQMMGVVTAAVSVLLLVLLGTTGHGVATAKGAAEPATKSPAAKAPAAASPAASGAVMAASSAPVPCYAPTSR